MDKRGAEGVSGAAPFCFVWTKPIPLHGIGTYRTTDILEVLLAQIGELDIDFTANLIIG
jgi:hypothetical protein